MAKKKVKTFVKLLSTAGTGFFYIARRNPKAKEKLECRKYDRVIRKHVLFKESSK